MNTVTVFFLVLAILSGITAVVLFFVFRIPHLLFVLTGIGAKREIKRIARGEVQTRAPSAAIAFDETTILSEQQKNETTVLSDDDLISGLSESDNTKFPFRIKKDVVIKKGLQKQE